MSDKHRRTEQQQSQWTVAWYTTDALRRLPANSSFTANTLRQMMPREALPAPLKVIESTLWRHLHNQYIRRRQHDDGEIDYVLLRQPPAAQKKRRPMRQPREAPLALQATQPPAVGGLAATPLTERLLELAQDIERLERSRNPHISELSVQALSDELNRKLSAAAAAEESR